jgi:hypothetical protein
MPELDGYETARRLRSLGYKMPIIAFTAKASLDEEQRIREAGMQAIIFKVVHSTFHTIHQLAPRTLLIRHLDLAGLFFFLMCVWFSRSRMMNSFQKCDPSFTAVPNCLFSSLMSSFNVIL